VSAKHRIDEDTSLEEFAALVCKTLEQAVREFERRLRESANE
jgi:hypothetical protein